MFDLEKIRKMYQRAAEEKWPYPYIFNSLKSFGVERYEVNVLTHEIKYVGEGKSFVEGPPQGFSPLPAGAAYNLEALKLAIERVQRRETTYPQFLAEIAAAGVSFYRVDMKPRTVTYHGPGQHKHVEKVPET
ncbi:MAG: hypothetical protein KCHDKBKB_01773 [Elusimicrobia bacterium]|nr:hypothetical protein [Elusimicrobiota bacterium]